MLQEEDRQAYRIPLDKWKLSFRDRTGLVTRKELPDVTFNIFQIELLLEGEVYGILHKFMEEMYENGRLNRFSFIKLTPGSVQKDYFPAVMGKCRNLIRNHGVRLLHVDVYHALALVPQVFQHAVDTCHLQFIICFFRIGALAEVAITIK